jgi:glycosyltransferase involved in cell wall biosynthesis
MRVLFVNRMASMIRGGGETFDIEIARQLEKRGCDITFLTGIPFFSNAVTSPGFTKNHTIRTPYTGWFRWEKNRGGWRVRLADFWIFEQRAAAWAAARQTQFDVVQVCELPTFVNVWKKRNGRPPVVMRLTAPDYYDTGGGIHRADAVIASGDTLKKVRAAVRHDCVDVPNGVDADVFRPHDSKFRERIGVARDEFVVLSVARFLDAKCHWVLIDAFAAFQAQWPKARLVLAGSGPLERDVRARAEEKGIASRVVFLGDVPFAGMPEVYAGADVEVISSEYESFSFAALEAMSSGLPVLTTETEWVPALIRREQGGRVVPLYNPAAMTDALRSLAGNPQLRAEMGWRNRERVVAGFGWGSGADRLLALYRELIHSAK